MSHSMNGRPLWCPPARTRNGTADRVESGDTCDNKALLAQAAKLVALAIRRGLAVPGPVIPEREVKEAQYRRVCVICDTPFESAWYKKATCSKECATENHRRAFHKGVETRRKKQQQKQQQDENQTQ